MKLFLSERFGPDPHPPPYASLDYSLKKSQNPKIKNTVFLLKVKISFFLAACGPRIQFIVCFIRSVDYEFLLSTLKICVSLIYNYI